MIPAFISNHSFLKRVQPELCLIAGCSEESAQIHSLAWLITMNNVK